MSNELTTTTAQPSGVIRLVAPMDDLVASFKEYEKACEALLTKDDYQTVRTKQGTRTFKKKSAWRKIATAFGVSTEVIRSEIEYAEIEKDGKIKRLVHHAEFTVRAMAPNGRYMDAWAGASVEDRDFAHDQDVAALAQTRATSRAIADLIGCGEVSAEEMEQDQRPGRREAAPVPPPTAAQKWRDGLSEEDRKIWDYWLNEQRHWTDAAKLTLAMDEYHGTPEVPGVEGNTILGPKVLALINAVAKRKKATWLDSLNCFEIVEAATAEPVTTAEGV